MKAISLQSFLRLSRNFNGVVDVNRAGGLFIFAFVLFDTLVDTFHSPVI